MSSAPYLVNVVAGRTGLGSPPLPVAGVFLIAPACDRVQVRPDGHRRPKSAVTASGWITFQTGAVLPLALGLAELAWPEVLR